MTLPDGAYWQIGEQTGIDANDKPTHTFLAKGLYDGLHTLLKTLHSGDVVEIAGGKYALQSANLTRGAGDTGTLALTCLEVTFYNEGSAEQPQLVQKALDETWTLRSCRNDVSILAYCGPSEGNNPNRAQIEAWQKEPDGEVAKEYKFIDSSGTEITLAGNTLELAQKIAGGVDSVIRFYPMLTRTRTYSKIPDRIYEKLGFIDEPKLGDLEKEVERINAPSNLGEIISGHKWLKCQDDTAKSADGNFQRVEAWMGVPSADGAGWDEDLYGDDRWPMPLGGK